MLTLLTDFCSINLEWQTIDSTCDKRSPVKYNIKFIITSDPQLQHFCCSTVNCSIFNLFLKNIHFNSCGITSFDGSIYYSIALPLMLNSFGYHFI